MAEPSQSGRHFGVRGLLAFALLKIAVHLLSTALASYGYFRDELYYIACAHHPALGYVDQPPFSIWVLAVNQSVLGNSLISLRLPAAIAGAATVFLVGLIARELGGGKFSQTLAMIAALVSPIYLAMDGFFSMNSFDILVWAGAGYTLIRLLKDERSKYWIILGLVLGVGLLNKISVLWLGAGIAGGLLFTSHRRWFTTKWPWIAGALAFILFLPYMLWNLQHDFAHLEFIRNASGVKYSSQNLRTFMAGQILINNPLSLPLWIAGLIFYFARDQQRFRPVGVVFVVSFLILAINGHSKAEYLAPAYTMLFAGGGVLFERMLTTRFRRVLCSGYAALLAAGGIVLAPLSIPVLPVESYIRYADALGMKPSSAESKELGKLSQHFADMFGWEEKAEAVARVYNTLTPMEKTQCAIFADNYGRCAAIDFFGAKYGLPKSIGNHNNYWIWGPGNASGEIVIILGGNPKTTSGILTRCMSRTLHGATTACCMRMRFR